MFFLKPNILRGCNPPHKPWSFATISCNPFVKAFSLQKINNPSYKFRFVVALIIQWPLIYEKKNFLNKFLTCRLGMACNARRFQTAIPQKGSWRQPAQGKCSVPCDDWWQPGRCGKSSAFRRKPPGRAQRTAFWWCIVAPLFHKGDSGSAGSLHLCSFNSFRP